MSAGAQAEDAVAVRRLRARGLTDSVLRRELAAIATPRVPQWIFVPRLAVRGAPQSIGATLQTALQRLAAEATAEAVSYPDFPALVVACARSALAGALGSSWHWSALGLPRAASPGEAVGRLLAAQPLEAGAAVAALAHHALLREVWRSLPDRVAVELTTALVRATRIAAPEWPRSDAGATDNPVPESALARAAAFWAPVLSGLAPRGEPVRAAAVLALLRWWPQSLATASAVLPAALLTRITDTERPGPRASAQATPDSPGARAPAPPAAPASLEPPVLQAGPDEPADVAQAVETLIDTEAPAAIATAWGGALFLVNALNRLDLAARLGALGDEPPSGWRLLLELALAHGMPPDEPLADFLTALDPETVAPAGFVEELMAAIEGLYARAGPWPLPLAQPARIVATETHVDLHLDCGTVDLAVRRAGLDFDPGWVPWLGRVVQFHYDHVPVHTAGARRP